MQDYILPKITGYDLRIKNPLAIPKIRTTNYGIRSQSFQGQKIWNSLPDSIKKAKNTKEFTGLIKLGFLRTNVPVHSAVCS